MRNLTHIAVPKDNDIKFPFSTIRNETPTQEGTPVIRELYGDIITNVWKIIQLSGIIFTGDEDSDTTQYQLVDALRKFHNELNDVEQVLSLSGTIWAIPLNIDLLPDKYVFIGRAADDYDSAINYQFKGSTATTINATSPTGFKLNDEVLTVIDSIGVRMYSLTQLTTASGTQFNILSAPLSFNDTNKVFYLSDAKLYTDDPSIYEIEQVIQTSASDVNLKLSDAIVYSQKLICLVYNILSQSYRVFTFPIGNLSTPTECTYNGFGVTSGADNGVYMYCDGGFLYFSNEFNASVDDFALSKISFDSGTNALTFVSGISLPDPDFIKTTNTVIINNKLYTFIGNTLKSIDLTTLAVSTVFSNFTLFVGLIFSYNNQIYYTKDEVALPWTI